MVCFVWNPIVSLQIFDIEIDKKLVKCYDDTVFVLFRYGISVFFYWFSTCTVSQTVKPKFDSSGFDPAKIGLIDPEFSRVDLEFT